MAEKQKLETIKTVRVSKTTLSLAKELMKTYPDIFDSFSSVSRAGIHQLHKQKIMKGGKDF